MNQPTTLTAPINVAEFETAARGKISREAYDYYAGGAGDEVTLARNQTAFHNIELLPKVLVDVNARDMRTNVLGQSVALPVLVAPMAFHKMAYPEGEIATARGSHAANTIMIASTLSNFSLEKIAETGANLWFQLYVFKDREFSRSLVQRAEAAGYKALVLTVDAPVLGRRDRDSRNRFRLPDELSLANFEHLTIEAPPTTVADSGLFHHFVKLHDASLTWKDLEWFTSITNLPIIVKGILRPDDAMLAIKHGASGVVVSNHGGRQLDTTVASINAVPRIVDALDGRGEVYMDGGVRRGTDVLKALAYGVKAVLIGRPILWGLAADGSAGVQAVLDTIRAELDLAMALSGCPTIGSITRDLIYDESHRFADR